MAAVGPTEAQKPIWQSAKLIYVLVVVVLVVGALLTLAIMGHVQVASEQIFDFGKWLITMLVGGHSLQEIVRYGATAVIERSKQETGGAAEPAVLPIAEEEGNAA